MTTTSGGDIVIGDGEGVSLEAPDVPAPELGANPLTIRGEVTFDPAVPLFGDDGETPPTGLWVTRGARLQVDTSTGTTFVLGFPAGIRIDGTVECHPQLAQAPGSELILTTGGTLLVTGRIDTSGLEGGGNAARVSLHGAAGILVRGDLLARGSDGDTGSDGGVVLIQSPGPVACSASIDTSGGRGLAGTGGRAGLVHVTAGPGQLVHFSGSLTGRGGDGAAGGGIGGGLTLTGGDLFSSAPVVVPGGAATLDGLGGQGGVVQATTPAGRVVLTGGVTAPGGAGAGEGAGGAGGQIHIQAVTSAPGALATLRGDIDVSGGAGATGGVGGFVLVTGVLPLPATEPHEGPAIAMPGFATLDASGGAGAAKGGDGGGVALEQGPLFINEQAYFGSAFVDADLRAVGGAGETGNGGIGGQAVVQSKDIVCRDLSADGGSSREATGGAGGFAVLITVQGRVSYGSASAMGGTGAIAQGTAGLVIIQASEVDILAESSGH